MPIVARTKPVNAKKYDVEGRVFERLVQLSLLLSVLAVVESPKTAGYAFADASHPDFFGSGSAHDGVDMPR